MRSTISIANVLSILAVPVKAEFGISDAAMGLLLGPAFAMFCSGLAIPVAWVADRHSRRGLIAAGMVVWSVSTAATGLAQSALQVALARIGVGVGESAGAAPAQSLIVDYFPPERRTLALSILQMGVTIGQMLGMLIGGLLVAPLGWRAVFFVVGLPGIAFALLLRLTVREPARTIKLPRAASLGDELAAFAKSTRRARAHPDVRRDRDRRHDRGRGGHGLRLLGAAAVRAIAWHVARRVRRHVRDRERRRGHHRAARVGHARRSPRARRSALAAARRRGLGRALDADPDRDLLGSAPDGRDLAVGAVGARRCGLCARDLRDRAEPSRRHSRAR
jgi:hypothetical protein